jgi:hypothetical protein
MKSRCNTNDTLGYPKQSLTHSHRHSCRRGIAIRIRDGIGVGIRAGKACVRSVGTLGRRAAHRPIRALGIGGDRGRRRPQVIIR